MLRSSGRLFCAALYKASEASHANPQSGDVTDGRRGMTSNTIVAKCRKLRATISGEPEAPPPSCLAGLVARSVVWAQHGQSELALLQVHAHNPDTDRLVDLQYLAHVLDEAPLHL